MPERNHPDLFSPEEQAISKTGDKSGAFSKPPPEEQDARDPSTTPADQARSSAKPTSDEQSLPDEEVEEGIDRADSDQRYQDRIKRAREENS